MDNIKLLDCTLRDGGYINNWNFGYIPIKNIVKKLTESNVDYIEVGFLRDCIYDKNKTLFNNCAEIQNVLPVKTGNGLYTAMALHNKYDINKLEPYDGKTIDALRVTFHDYDIEKGLEFISKAIEKGYKVFANPINIMGYSDKQILRLLDCINQIRPYAFSIVDTFGSMMKPDLVRIYSLIQHNMDESIIIGLHLHENLALSFSLAQEFIAMKDSNRKCVIDASMLGMGRAPGNLCLELIMDFMNRNLGGIYNVNPILDGIDDYIAKLKEVEPWGYNTAYALAAKYNLHRNYAEALLNKERLRAKKMNQILSSIEESKKTTFDEGYINELYMNFINNDYNDEKLIKQLSDSFKDKEILIIAPGTSIIKEKATIDNFIKEKNPVVIAANFKTEDYRYDYIFCTNAMRYEGLDQNKDNVLITSNLLDICENRENVLNYAELNFDENGACDNCVIMLMKLLIRLQMKSVYLAGFDGYMDNGKNYVHSYMKSQYTKGQKENVQIQKYLQDLYKKLDIIFLTKSLYQSKE